jgi:hypothetical protein
MLACSGASARNIIAGHARRGAAARCAALQRFVLQHNLVPFVLEDTEGLTHTTAVGEWERAVLYAAIIEADKFFEKVCSIAHANTHRRTRVHTGTNLRLRYTAIWVLVSMHTTTMRPSLHDESTFGTCANRRSACAELVHVLGRHNLSARQRLVSEARKCRRVHSIVRSGVAPHALR